MSAKRVLNEWNRTLECWSQMRVLVMGDVMLDVERYLQPGDTFNEFGTHVMKEVDRRLRPGGAANLAVNLKSLGCAEVHLIGAVADDPEGAAVSDLLSDHGVRFLGRHTYRQRRVAGTTVKERVYHQTNGGWQGLLRMDRDAINPLPIRWVLEDLNYRHYERKFDALVLSDYQKGAFQCRAEIEEICKTFRGLHPDGFITANLKPKTIHEMYTDGKSDHMELALIQLNETEMEALVGEHCRDPSGEILRVTGCGHVLHTMGARGLRLYCEDETSAEALGLRIKVGSLVGAGDTTLAAATMAMHSEVGLEAQVTIANAAGAARVERVDRQWITAEDIRSMLERKVY